MSSCIQCTSKQAIVPAAYLHYDHEIGLVEPMFCSDACALEFAADRVVELYTYDHELNEWVSK